MVAEARGHARSGTSPGATPAHSVATRREGVRVTDVTGADIRDHCALTEVLLAGGDFLSDRSLIADQATRVLRGSNAVPSVSTLWRFLARADLGRLPKAAATNRVMLRRAWAAGAAPQGDRLTIDPDATRAAVFGPGKEGSAFSTLLEPGKVLIQGRGQPQHPVQLGPRGHPGRRGQRHIRAPQTHPTTTHPTPLPRPLRTTPSYTH